MGDSFHIQWHITNLCNLRCIHCYQENFSSSNDLDWTGLKKVSENILTGLKEWDRTGCVHLTGGEPLLNKYLMPLLENLDNSSAIEEIGIITNGLLFDREVMRRLARFSKLKKIKISLDGGDAETHDSVRQKETFKKVVQNIPLIREMGGFEIFFMFTVMKRNLRSLPSLFRLYKDLGIEGLIIERFIPLGKGRSLLEEVLDKNQWKEMVETLLDFFSIKTEVEDAFSYQAFQITSNEGELELLGAPCVIGMDGLCIMPEGNVFPCRRLPISIGNLLNVSLKQIWEGSEILEKLRRKENLRGKCGNCEIKNCRGCRSLALALTGNYLEEDPHCWYVDI